MRLKPRKPGESYFPMCQSPLLTLRIVTEDSIRFLKRRALVRSKTLHRDTETGDVIPPSKISTFFSTLKTPFRRSFWEDRLESSDGEMLVDGKLLSYAYLEVGVIECLARQVSLPICLWLSFILHPNLSLLAYFVVFFKNGFSPSDLVTAQKAGCMS